MLKSAFSSAVLNVKINLKYIEDKEYVEAVSLKIVALDKIISGASKEITDKINSSFA